MFNPEQKAVKDKRTYSLSAPAIKYIGQLAKHYNATHSAVVEELVMTTAPKILAEHESK